MAQHPRGIAPDLLLSQVRNTMPSLFERDSQVSRELLESYPPARTMLDFAANPRAELSHFEYFRLCLSAHYLTVATPVPTDVDNQIRQKLWPRNLELDTALQMAEHVLESRHFDFPRVTRRLVRGADKTPWEGASLHGHLGEWFTVSCGAYCAFAQYGAAPEGLKMRERLLAEIADEVNRHSDIFGSFWRAGDGFRALLASAAIAHNFGDLDRVMDMWSLPVNDPLRLQFYKAAAQPFDQNRKLRFLGRLWVAGELYKSVIEGSSMALENHRHYALRKPRYLRDHPDFMITTGPFFDEWGERLVAGLPEEQLADLVEVLKSAWDRQPKTLGYGRALCAILESRPDLQLTGSQQGFGREKELKQLRKLDRSRFEARWSEQACSLLEDIPSRA